ncbi:imidazole glycerol phosphate synthase subunit HisH [Photobacterium leiognathi]|uniref:imidazole glycerol phosphate synthase subunit HisH n=1 Tax=Photobacterium leiognathi TaxID=553611 RepID=UPI002982127D|nr:imidazole glycerol phosphate synthase subunit HisH [Photobacterium leiognathi]
MNKNDIEIINTGIGNIASVANMIKKAGGNPIICNKPSELSGNSKLLLPGVGSFDHGMNLLTTQGWIEPLNNLVLNKKVPILGICLGMQMMLLKSEEGQKNGLGWIDGEVIKFKRENIGGLKIPHMGWNIVKSLKDNSYIDVDNESRFYFVHSYHVQCNNEHDIMLSCNYGYDFTCAFSHENIIGAQFHPEKSHKFGIHFFKKYLEL